MKPYNRIAYSFLLLISSYSSTVLSSHERYSLSIGRFLWPISLAATSSTIACSYLFCLLTLHDKIELLRLPPSSCIGVPLVVGGGYLHILKWLSLGLDLRYQQGHYNYFLHDTRVGIKMWSVKLKVRRRHPRRKNLVVRRGRHSDNIKRLFPSWRVLWCILWIFWERPRGIPQYLNFPMYWSSSWKPYNSFLS